MSESSVPAPAATPKIEVLALRDPDGPPEVYVLVDGAEAAFSFESVDPGAGHDIEGWREHTETVRENPEYSEAFKRLVVETRIAHEDSEYITGDGGDDETRDLAACRTETDFERHIQKYGR